MVTNNVDDPAGLYRNDATELFPANKHLTVRLNGDAPNTFGVGAKVILKNKDSLQVQQLMPTRGFESSVAPELLFGLGRRTTVDSLIVIWPNGRMEVRTDVKVNQILTLRQTDARLDATRYRYTAPVGQPLLLTGHDGFAAVSTPGRYRVF